MLALFAALSSQIYAGFLYLLFSGVLGYCTAHGLVAENDSGSLLEKPRTGRCSFRLRFPMSTGAIDYLENGWFFHPGPKGVTQMTPTYPLSASLAAVDHSAR